MQEVDSEFAFRKVLQNFTVLSVAELINKALLFVTTAYLARTLGPSGFGVMGFALAVVTYFKMIVDGGLGVHGTREVARQPSQGGQIVSSIIFLRVILLFIALAAVFLFVALVHRSSIEENTILLYSLTFLPFVFSLDWYFYGKEKAGWVATGLLVTQIIFATGVIVLVERSENLLRVPVIQTFAEILAAVVLLAAYLKGEKFDFSGLQKKILRKIVSASTPIALSNAMRTVNFTFDIVLIGFLMPPEPVGWYTAAYRFVYFLVGFGMLYFQSFLAPISRSVQEGGKSASLLLSQSLKAAAVAVLPAAAGTTIVAAQLLSLVYGEGYSAATVPLQILIWSAVLIVLNGNFRQALIASGEQRKLLKNTAASAASNIILNFILIPRYGLAGAALATVISELFLIALCFRSITKLGISTPLLSSLAGPLSCTAIMSGILYFTARYGLAIAILSSVAVYISALFLTRTISTGVHSKRIGAE